MSRHQASMESRVAAVLRNDTPANKGSNPALSTSDPIELSNACRAFYQARLQSARTLRERWAGASHSQSDSDYHTTDSDSDNNGNRRKKSSIDIAMETLRSEMASLMDQDLSLMRQLLTLNEEIEELKWRRRYCWSRSSVLTSSGDVDLGSAADFTSSETSLGWWAESGDIPAKYPSPSTLSLHAEHGRLSVYDEEDPMGTFNRRAARNKLGISNLTRAMTPSSSQSPQKSGEQHKADVNPVVHAATGTVYGTGGYMHKGVNYKERESFDSGIHEGYSGSDLHTNSMTEVTHL